MLCTFIADSTGSSAIEPERILVIRSEDIRQIEDQPSGETLLLWQCGAEIHSAFVTGTATENTQRLLQEELDAMSRIAAHQQATQARVQQGFPVTPVLRGKVRS